MKGPPRYDLAEFASRLAAGLSARDPGAVAMPSQTAQDEWVVQWRDEKVYGYVLTNAASMGQPARVNIRLVHPAFDTMIKDDAQITVRHDRPIADIVQAIEHRLIGRVSELANRSDRIRWNKGFSPNEIEWNDYRRNRLNRIWRASHSLPFDHPFFVHEVTVPEMPGPGGRVCDFGEMEIDINDFSDPQVAYCLGYLEARFDLLAEFGVLEEMFENTDTESWPALLDALTEHQYQIEEESQPEDDDDEISLQIGVAEMAEDRRRKNAAPRQWTPNDVQRTLMDPRAAGVGGFPAIVDDAAWVAANVKLIESVGADTYLTTLLDLLHEICDP